MVDGREVIQPIRVKVRSGVGVHAAIYDEEHPRDYTSTNIFRGEHAGLPHDSNILQIEFAMQAMPNTRQPESCDSPEFRGRAIDFIGGYHKAGGFKELALRYAINLANARWAWRNRSESFEAEITITTTKGESLIFDAHAFDLESFDLSAQPEEVIYGINQIAGVIESGLSGLNNRPTLLRVRGRFTMMNGADVWPSQEFIELNKEARQDGETKKFLLSISALGVPDAAALRDTKIGAAIRTIDSWYEPSMPEPDKARPIAVNPYGQDRSTFTTLRKDGPGPDFYQLLRARLNAPFTGLEPQDHFIVATMVRGGVFGFGKSEKLKSEQKSLVNKAGSTGERPASAPALTPATSTGRPKNIKSSKDVKSKL
jgi:CRISPR-associated protein Csy3